MDLGFIILTAVAFVYEIILFYYKQRIENIPIFFTFLPFYIFSKEISEIYILVSVLLFSILVFVLKEFSVNFEYEFKSYNIISKSLFVFLILGFLCLFIIIGGKLFSFVIFYLVFSYFYTILWMGFISSYIEKKLKGSFWEYIEQVSKEKEFFNNELQEEVLRVVLAILKTDKNIMPVKIALTEYFLLSCFIIVYYFFSLFSGLSLLNTIIFNSMYFSAVFILRIIYNNSIYDLANENLKSVINGLLNKQEINFLAKKVEENQLVNLKLVNWLRYLGEFYAKLDDNPDYEDLYSSMYSIVSKSLNFSRFIIFIYNDTDINGLKAVFFRGISREELYIKNTAVEIVYNSLKSVYYFGGTVFSALALFKDDRSFICSPIKIGKKFIGAVYISSFNTRNFNEEDVKFIEILCDKFAVMYILYQEYSKSREMAIRDGLTGLYTHRHFQELLSKEIGNAKLYGYPVCLLMIDTDKFKQYNDTFGHPMGDELLKNIAKIISSHVGNKGYVCRYGGDEFAVILPNFYKENAILLAEEIRKNYKVLKKGDIEVSASIGVACFPLDCSSKDELIKKADELLYKAKKEGRNRVIWQ